MTHACRISGCCVGSVRREATAPGVDKAARAHGLCLRLAGLLLRLGAQRLVSASWRRAQVYPAWSVRISAPEGDAAAPSHLWKPCNTAPRRAAGPVHGEREAAGA